MSELLAYLCAGVIARWGVAHAIPTRAVVGGLPLPSSRPHWAHGHRCTAAA